MSVNECIRVLGVIANPFDLRKAEKHAVKSVPEAVPLQSKYISTPQSGRSEVYAGQEIGYSERIYSSTGSYKGAPTVELSRMQAYDDQTITQSHLSAPTNHGEGGYIGGLNAELRRPQPYEGT